MNPEWIVAGIILLGGMAAGGISLYIRRKKVAKITDSFGEGNQLDEGKK